MGELIHGSTSTVSLNVHDFMHRLLRFQEENVFSFPSGSAACAVKSPSNITSPERCPTSAQILLKLRELWTLLKDCKLKS